MKKDPAFFSYTGFFHAQKIFFFFTIFSLLAGCALEKEPLVPEYTNEISPAFKNITVKFITHDSLYALAQLSSRGNINVIDFGWIISDQINATIESNARVIRFTKLTTDSFATYVSGLEVGKTYFIRPFLSNHSGVYYGGDKRISNEFAKIENFSLSKDSACLFSFNYNVKNTGSIEEHGLLYIEGDQKPSYESASKVLGEPNAVAGEFKVDAYNLKPNTLYSVCIFAKTAAGVTLSDVRKFTTVGSRPLIHLDFSINTDSIIFKGAIVKFSNGSNGANHYHWKFGNEAESTDFSPTHLFQSLGLSKVILQGEKHGCIETKQLNLDIRTNPFEEYWVKLPGGSFMMGCTDEQANFCDPKDEMPAHKVTLSPFEIGKTEITQRQWIAVMGYNPSYFNNCGQDCPVELVDYYNIVQNFIPRLNRKTGREHRLPTEAEWEYAARGGQSFLYAGSNSISEVGWHFGNSDSKTYKVGLKKPNGFGLYDMTGNVWEWCSDLYATTYYQRSPELNPQGPAQTNADLRVRRGGSFDTSVNEYNPRVSFRYYWSHYRGNWTTGLRLVRNIQ